MATGLKLSLQVCPAAKTRHSWFHCNSSALRTFNRPCGLFLFSLNLLDDLSRQQSNSVIEDSSLSALVVSCSHNSCSLQLSPPFATTNTLGLSNHKDSPLLVVIPPTSSQQHPAPNLSLSRPSITSLHPQSYHYSPQLPSLSLLPSIHAPCHCLSFG